MPRTKGSGRRKSASEVALAVVQSGAVKDLKKLDIVAGRPLLPAERREISRILNGLSKDEPDIDLAGIVKYNDIITRLRDARVTATRMLVSDRVVSILSHLTPRNIADMDFGERRRWLLALATQGKSLADMPSTTVNVNVDTMKTIREEKERLLKLMMNNPTGVIDVKEEEEEDVIDAEERYIDEINSEPLIPEHEQITIDTSDISAPVLTSDSDAEDIMDDVIKEQLRLVADAPE